MELLTKRYAEKIIGTLCCYDRIVVKGTLPTICYAEGMTRYLAKNNIIVFDYAKFAEPFREKIKMTAEQLASTNGLLIEFIRSSKARKEDIVKKHYFQPFRSFRSYEGSQWKVSGVYISH